MSVGHKWNRHYRPVWTIKGLSDASLRVALETARKAVALDGASAKAHMILGDAYVWLGRVEDAYAEGKRSIELSPNFADAQFLFSWYAAWAGKVEEAIDSATTALRLDHNTTFLGYHFALGHAYFLAKRIPKAIEKLEESVRCEANVWFPRWWLIAAYGHLNQQERVRPHLEELARIRNMPIEDITVDAPLLPSELRYKNPEHWELLVSGLRKAGLPE